MMLTAIRATDSSNVRLDESPDPVRTGSISAQKTLKVQDGIIAVATAFSLIQGQATISTNTAPVRVVHRDNRTTVADTRYEQPKQDIDITEWFRYAGLDLLDNEEKTYRLGMSAQEVVMPYLERSRAGIKALPARVRASDAFQDEINEADVVSATKFLKSVRVDDDIADDGEALAYLENLLRIHGIGFVNALSTHLSNDSLRDSITSTILVLLGQAEHPTTHGRRLNLLLDMLFSPKVRVRDGAVAGLGYMMSKEAIQALRIAAGGEKNQYVRHDMENLLRLLTEL